jgi:hypothetical protein
MQAGDFILFESEIPRHYVRGDYLGLIILAQAAHTSWDYVEESGVRGLVHLPEFQLSTLTVFEEQLQADADTANISSEYIGVFPVYHRETRVGWYFADSMWMRPSTRDSTLRGIYFYCTKGHENTKQDRGYCSRCPAPLKTVIVR